MKKLTKILLITLILFSVTGCFFDKKVEEVEENVNTKEMKELPKVVFEKLEKYIKDNDIETVAKNMGEFDIRSIDMGNGLYLNNNSYYYVSGGEVFLYVEYTYNKKYLVKMTISDTKDNIASFSYTRIDKE